MKKTMHFVALISMLIAPNVFAGAAGGGGGVVGIMLDKLEGIHSLQLLSPAIDPALGQILVRPDVYQRTKLRLSAIPVSTVVDTDGENHKVFANGASIITSDGKAQILPDFSAP